MVNDRNERPEVELTLKSLHGIAWKSDEGVAPKGDSEPPNVTATVAFTGSASNMQVSSSTMCSRTGNLVIESLSMNPDDARQTSGAEICYPLVATFHDAVEGNNSALPTPVSASIVDSSLRPDLTLRLPSRDPNLPAMPLAEVNRNSRVVPSSQSWVESEANESKMPGATKESWRQSVLWSPTGTSMPEIIELNVTLRSEDNTVYQEGIAHLLFFQQGESGITTLDLPVKKKVGHAQSMVTLQPDAYIRVQIAIIKSADEAPTLTPTSTTTSTSSEWSQEMEEEQKLSGNMDQWKEHEVMAAARATTAKLEFHEQAVETPKKRLAPPMMCAAFDVRNTMQAFGDAFRKCDAPEACNNGFERYGVKCSNSTMGSTIATRESLEI
jgi:hypothetical protein